MKPGLSSFEMNNQISSTGKCLQARSVGARAAALLSLLLLAPGPVLSAETANHLTPDEIAEGWKLLFDGTSSEGWRGFQRTGFPHHSWVLEDGSLKNLPSPRRESFLSSVLRPIKHWLAGRRRCHLITLDRYREFDFRFEVRLFPDGNTGVKYFILEEGGEAIGHEYQIIDRRGPDWPSDKKTAALYDVLPASDNAMRSAGFNQGRIAVCGDRVEHWLNGEKVLEYRLGSDQLKAAIQESKFQDVPGFGEGARGHLVLQDHGDVVWFRNLKILDLSGRCQSEARK